jgi:hypothetical protein
MRLDAAAFVRVWRVQRDGRCSRAYGSLGAMRRTAGCSAVPSHAWCRRDCKTKSGKASEAAALVLLTPVGRLLLLSRVFPAVRGRMNQNQNKTQQETCCAACN